MIIYYLILYLSMIVAAFSQICLKLGADRSSSGRFILLNFWVVVGYALLFASLFLNIIGLRHVPLSHMAFILPTVYVLVIFLSKSIFKEKIGHKKIAGTVLIIAGTIVFNL